MTCASRIGTKDGKEPSTRNPSPISTYPMTMDRRREYTSATMPVGTSNTNAEISSAVPTRISCTGVSPATVASYNEVTTNIIAKKAEALNSMNKYTNLALNFTLENICTFIELKRMLQLYTDRSINELQQRQAKEKSPFCQRLLIENRIVML